MNSWMFVGASGENLPAPTGDWDFTSATLPIDWTLKREAAALGRDASGRWVSVPADQPRHWVDPVTFENQGMLVETDRTQLVYRSRFMTGTPVAGTNVADTTTQTPFGLGGRLIVPSTALALHGFDLYFDGAANGRAAAIPDGSRIAVQMYLKPVGIYRRFALNLLGRDGVYSAVDFLLDGDGQILSSTATGSANIFPDTDGFYRLEVVHDFGTGTINPATLLGFRLQDGTRSFAGDGTSGVLVAYWGAEIGLECSSPIITTGTPVTRPADVLTSNPIWLNRGSKSIGIQFTRRTSAQTAILSLSGVDRLELIEDNDTTFLAGSVPGGTPLNEPSPAVPIGTEQTVVMRGSVDVFGPGVSIVYSRDGTSLGGTQSASLPDDLSFVRIGARQNGGLAGALLVRRMRYWPIGLDWDELKAFSQQLDLGGTPMARPVLDIQPAITIQPSTTTLNLTVTLTGELSGSSFQYRTVNGTALAGTDFDEEAGTTSIDPGQTSAVITIQLLERSTAADRTFTVELFRPIGAVLGSSICTVTLLKAPLTSVSPIVATVFNSSTLPSDWTFTRATPAWKRNASGAWEQVAAGVPRLHYNAAGVAGLLLEPASEQRLFESVNLFYLSNSTQTLDTTTPTPTGNRSVIWRETAVTAGHLLRAEWNSTQADWPTGEFVMWAIIKPVGPRTLYRWSVRGIDNIWTQTIFDFSGNSGKGSVVSSQGPSFGIIEPEPMASGWFRLGVNRAQAVTANVNPAFDLQPVDANNANALPGNTSYGFDLCHFQVEPGSMWASPIPVTGATAKTVRAQDVLKAAGVFHHRSTFALGTRFIRLTDYPASREQRIVQFRDADPAVDDYGLLLASGGVFRTAMTTGGTFRAPALDGPAVPKNTATTAIFSMDENRAATWLNGTLVGQYAADTFTPPRLVEHLRFGSKEQGGIQSAPILLQAAAFWDVGLKDAEGASYSTDLSSPPPPDGEPDPLPVVSIPAALNVREGEWIDLPLSKSGTGACSVSFTTRASTATYNVDYTGVGPITVSFGANEPSRTVRVQTIADAVADAGEKFGIEISAPVGCTLGNAQGAVTILEPPSVSIAAAVSVTEGGQAVVTVLKQGIGACSVTWRTVAQTATVGVDYVGVDPTVITFEPNEASKTVMVQTLVNAEAEPPEVFNVVLQSPVDCTLSNATCAVTILDPNAPEEPVATAFPKAIGFASAAACGTGYPIYRVTNLNDSGTGSLRTGCAAGNNMIVFEVGGRIMLQSDLPIGSNCTIAGETAPAPGITIQKFEFGIRSSNARISHITFQKGYDANDRDNGDVGKVAPGSGTVPAGGKLVTTNIHFYHCAFYWGMDETIEHWPWNSRTLTNVSYHDCIFAEPLHKPSTYDSSLLNHVKMYGVNAQPTHNYGVIFGFGSRRIDQQYCLFADMDMREPFIDATTEIVLANMIANNCTKGATIQQNQDPAPGTYLTTVKGYLCISGPNSGTSAYGGFRFHSYRLPQPANSKVYVAPGSLYGWKGGTSTSTYQQPQTKVTYGNSAESFEGVVGKPYWLNGSTKVAVEVSTPPIDTPTPTVALTAQQIYDRAVLNIGPRPKEIRDVLAGKPGAIGNKDVARTVQRLKDKTGKWVNHEGEYGGFYAPVTVTRKLDGTTTFPNGTTIPAPPAQPQPATDASRKAMNDWLRLFLDQIQYD